MQVWSLCLILNKSAATGGCRVMDSGRIIAFLGAALQGKIEGVAKTATEQERLLETLYEAIGQLPVDVLSSPEMMNPLSLAILSALQASSPGSSSLSLRLLALNVLVLIFERCINEDLMFSVLPGVSSALLKLTGRVETENHEILVKSLRALELVLLKAVSEEPKDVLKDKLETIFRMLTKSASEAKDQRVVLAFSVFAEAMISHKPLRVMNLLPLCYQTGTMVADNEHLCPSIEETIRSVEDEGQSMETRIESIKYLLWLSSTVDPMKPIPYLVDIFQAQFDSSRKRLLVPASSSSPITMLFDVQDDELPDVFGPHMKALVECVDLAISDLPCLKEILEYREKNPEVTLILLGHVSIDPSLQETIIDECLKIYLRHQCVYSYLHCLGSLRFDLKPFLKYILVDLLTWIASPDPILSKYACCILKKISKPRPVIQLLRENVDYIIDQIGLQVRSPTVYPLSPKVLALILNLNLDVIPLIGDIFTEIIENLGLYKNHDAFVYDLLEVLSVSSPHAQKSSKDIIHIVTHFVLSDRRKIRKRALEVLTGFFNTFDKEIFLPLVHYMWQSVLSQVCDPLTSEQAIVCIAQMSTVAGDFMNTRISKELWPALKKQMSSDKASRSHIFKGLTVLVEHVKFTMRMVQDLAMIIADSLRQSSLVDVSMTLAKKLIAAAPETMWFVLVCQFGTRSTYFEYRVSDLSSPALDHLLSTLGW